MTVRAGLRQTTISPRPEKQSAIEVATTRGGGELQLSRRPIPNQAGQDQGARWVQAENGSHGQPSVLDKTMNGLSGEEITRSDRVFEIPS